MGGLADLDADRQAVAELNATHPKHKHEGEHDGEFRRGHGAIVGPQISNAMRTPAHELTYASFWNAADAIIRRVLFERFAKSGAVKTGHRYITRTITMSPGLPGVNCQV